MPSRFLSLLVPSAIGPVAEELEGDDVSRQGERSSEGPRERTSPDEARATRVEEGRTTSLELPTVRPLPMGARRGVAVERDVEGTRVLQNRPPKRGKNGSPSAGRARLRLLNAMRGARIAVPPGRPPRKLLKGEPEYGGNAMADPGFGQPPPLIITIQAEARLSNALWTTTTENVDGVDVSVGKSAIWIARKLGGLRKVDRYTLDSSSFWYEAAEPSSENVGTGSQKLVRVSAGRSFDETEDVIFATRSSDGATLLIVGGKDCGNKAFAISGYGSIDIGAGRVVLPKPGSSSATGMYHDVFRIGPQGQVEQLFSVGSTWSWVPYNFGVYGPDFQAIAMERERKEQAFGWPDVWLLREDDHLVDLGSVEVIKDAANAEWWDLGASDNAVWTISSTPASEPNAKGNTLWRFDKSASRWDKMSGWGVALDVDSDGNPWVLDSEGRLHSRGTRVPSVAFDEIVRERKAWKETWDQFSLQTGIHLVGPAPPPKPAYQSIYDEYVKPVTAQSALYLEMINRAREVGAAASIQLLPWDAYALMAPVQKQRYRSLVAALIDSSRGFELLFSFAPIFTRSLHIPNVVLQAKEVKDLGSSYFKAETVKSEYLKAVKELASIPGFKERVRYFSLGNEVDIFLTSFGSQPEAQAVATAYVDFCKAVADPVRAILPRAKVGVCGTVRGLNDFPAFWDQILELSDVLICTYYAIADFTLQPLTAALYKSEFPGVLFSRATTSKGKKPIVIQEIGMPTDPAIGGSEAFQADFLDYVLSEWDKAKNWIAYLSWWRLNDFHYDPDLKVELADPADVNSPIVVTQTGTSPTGQKFDPYLTFQGIPVLPYIGTGNKLSPNFDGPKKPGAPPNAPVNSGDIVYFAQQSVLPTSVPFCRCFSSCGLVRADGTAKESFAVYKNWTKARRVQK